MTNDEIITELKNIRDFDLSNYNACSAKTVLTELISKLSPKEPKFKVGDFAIVAEHVVKIIGINNETNINYSVFNLFQKNEVKADEFFVFSFEEFIKKFGGKNG